MGKLQDSSRMEAFSDGVFGFAVTLIILDIRVPHIGEGRDGNVLWRSLLELWPSFLALVLSFVTVFIMWMNHHVMFKCLRGIDARIAIANGLVLLLIMMVPFPTALVAEYLTSPSASTACAVYSAFFILVNAAFIRLWHSATKNGRMLKPEVSPEFVNGITKHLYIGLSVYVIATIVAFLLPALSILVCSALWILWGRMAFVHFVPRNPKDDTKGSEIGPHEG
jgi:uncharacterized membrane protein